MKIVKLRSRNANWVKREGGIGRGVEELLNKQRQEIEGRARK